MSPPPADEVWWQRCQRALRDEGPAGSRAPTTQLLKRLTERYDELARFGELESVRVPARDGVPAHTTRVARGGDDAELLALFDELGELLGVGRVPRG
jgi:hypothetical protein